MSLRVRMVLLFTLAVLIFGSAGGLLLARRLQLGLESDLDGVMRQRAAAVAESIQPGASDPHAADVSEAEGPAQILSPNGQVLVAAGGASSQIPLLTNERLRRAGRGVFIVDALATFGNHRETVRVLGRPMPNGDIVAIAMDRDPVDDVVRRTLVELILLGTPALALVAFGVWLVTGAALRPVERMRAQAAAAAPGDPTVLTVPPGRDELSRLAHTLNDLLAAQQAALRAEQSFLADAGHELRTPLAILAGELEFADRPVRTEKDLRETVTVAREETTRLVRLAEQLLVLARVDGMSLARADVDVRALAKRAVIAWAATAGARDVQFVLQPGDDVVAWIDADRTRQMLDNLLANALRAAPAGSTVEISVTVMPAQAVELSVHDHGPGFPPDFLPYAFERFRRADVARARAGPATPGGSAEGSGNGLGLAVVQRIAEAHGGEANAGNGVDGGAIVRVLLPLNASAACQ
jgi:two-component system OmpR family sensor kinase